MEVMYILEGKEVVPCPDSIKWGKWAATADREVARETIGDSDISTVFLGLDHSLGEGPPLLFETLVFGGKLADEIDRYSTWDEAVLGHKAMVKKVKNAIKQKIEIMKRIITVLGLSAFVIAWAGLAVYGAICFARKIGWLL